MDVAVTIARAPAVLKKAIYPCRERMHQNNSWDNHLWVGNLHSNISDHAPVNEII